MSRLSMEVSAGTSKEKVESESEATKKGSTSQSTSGTTSQTTSGSINTSDILSQSNQQTSGRTDVSSVLGQTGSSTSGRTDTSTSSGSTNISSTDASQNTQINSGSVNTILNSGATNVTTQGPRTQTTVNSGSRNTSQLLLSQEAVDSMVRNILEGSSGLAATVRGSNISGVYNDTSRTLLTSDLVARTAGEVAARSAITEQIIGGSSSTTIDSGFDTTQVLGGSSTTQNIGGSTTTQNIGATKGTQQIGGGTTVTQVGGTTSSGFNSQGGVTHTGGVTTIGSNYQSGTQTIGGSTTTGASNQTSTGTSLEEAYAHSISDKQASEASAKSKWIVCTELYNQGRMPKRIYIPGFLTFNSYPDRYKRGYYIWAIPCVLHLKKHPKSLLSKFLEISLNARAEYITEIKYPGKGKITLGGWIATHVGWAVCKVLAVTIARNFTATSPEELEATKLKGKSHV